MKKETMILEIGSKIGRLTLLGEAPRKNGRKYWWCMCDCGNERAVQASHLKTGHTRSCGCLVKDRENLTMAECEADLLLREKLQICGYLKDDRRIVEELHVVDDTCLGSTARQKEISTNSSGHRGVSRRENGRWRAEITFRGHRYSLGSFATFEEAVKARQNGERICQDYLRAYYTGQEAADNAVEKEPC